MRPLIAILTVLVAGGLAGNASAQTCGTASNPCPGQGGSCVNFYTTQCVTATLNAQNARNTAQGDTPPNGCEYVFNNCTPTCSGANKNTCLTNCQNTYTQCFNNQQLTFESELISIDTTCQMGYDGCTEEQCGSEMFCTGAPCGNDGTEYCCDDSGGQHVCCTNGSPIIIDTANEGFHLTGVSEGITFRNEIGGPPVNISWTDPRFHNAWLALDRNGNGQIDALSELFGNYTPQPPSKDPNGFAALAVFDDPKNGG